MDKSKTFYAKTREEWRKWLEKNFREEKEIWFVFPTNASGECEYRITTR